MQHQRRKKKGKLNEEL